METVLITGAARRLGSLITEDLAASGCFVWIHYHSHEENAYALKERILANGGHADCVCAELTDTGEIDMMLDRILQSGNGSLTALINNASVFYQGTLPETSVTDWDLVMNTNLRAVWYLSSRFAELFPSAKRIITIGDAGTAAGYSKHAVYGLSKFALKYLTEQMASAFAPQIRVNLLSPGLVLKGESEPDFVWEKRLKRTLTDNSEIIDSIRKGIAFLMSDPGMTGAELIIDNGMRLKPNTQDNAG